MARNRVGESHQIIQASLQNAEDDLIVDAGIVVHNEISELRHVYQVGQQVS